MSILTNGQRVLSWTSELPAVAPCWSIASVADEWPIDHASGANQIIARHGAPVPTVATIPRVVAKREIVLVTQGILIGWPAQVADSLTCNRVPGIARFLRGDPPYAHVVPVALTIDHEIRRIDGYGFSRQPNHSLDVVR